MKILTGNDLETGAVIWWAGGDWSLHVADAVDVSDRGEAIAESESAARRVVGAYVIDARQEADGVRPGHIKDRIRAFGPTVRLDLAVKPGPSGLPGTAAADWVI